MNDKKYDFKKIEGEAQLFWEKNNTFVTKLQQDSTKEKYYVLGMFPYPSGTLHMGHLRNYAITDIIARFKRACGFEVLHPIGWDAFGLPAENAAIQNNINPEDWTKSNIENMRKELSNLGISYDWQNTFATCDPEYYVHEQKFFHTLLEKNLVYKKESWVNWDPIDKTVLANEQVIDGKGWRSGATIERKKMHQWHMRITNYAEQLLNDLKNLNQWPKSVLHMQEKWIGKKNGTKIFFKIKNSEETLEVFTTKPETIFASSFCAISPEHELVSKFLQKNPDAKKIVDSFAHTKENIGIKTQIALEHPLIEGKEIPLYIASFVISDYACGAVLCCPAHDERDYAFAKKQNLPIILSIQPIAKNDTCFTYTDEQVLINSGKFTGMKVKEARKKIIDCLIEKNLASNTIQYKLRDWCISRQRYWGCPIPIIHCPKCGIIPNKQLPVSFPKKINFSDSTSFNLSEWEKIKCPQCSSDATKETDTLDTFFESSWYFLGFTNKEKTMFDKRSNNIWMPVDLYVGGIEHAILHLLYSRLFAIILNQEGFLSNSNPFKQLLTQGMVCHKTYKDKDGNYIYPEEAENLKEVSVGKSVKMSKSKKNIISLKEITKNYGADTSRLFITSDSPPEKNLEWSNEGINGCYKFIKKIWNFGLEIKNIKLSSSHSKSEELSLLTNNAIKDVTTSIKELKLNSSIARLRELFNFMTTLDKQKTTNLKESFIIFLKMIEPFTPHIYFALIKILEPDKIETSWPKFDNSIVNKEKTITMNIAINGIKRATIDIKESDTQETITKNSKDKIINRLSNKKIEKIIIIKNKIINFVVTDEGQ